MRLVLETTEGRRKRRTNFVHTYILMQMSLASFELLTHPFRKCANLALLYLSRAMDVSKHENISIARSPPSLRQCVLMRLSLATRYQFERMARRCASYNGELISRSWEGPKTRARAQRSLESERQAMVKMDVLGRYRSAGPPTTFLDPAREKNNNDDQRLVQQIKARLELACHTRAHADRARIIGNRTSEDEGRVW